jgi:hypothetical protein
MTIGLLLDPQRAARLAAASAEDPRRLGLAEVIEEIWRATWRAPPGAASLSGVKRAVDQVALAATMALVSNTKAAPEVRAVAFGKVQDLRDWAAVQVVHARSAEERAHLQFAAAQIRGLEVAPQGSLKASEAGLLPPGPPIGSGDDCIGAGAAE